MGVDTKVLIDTKWTPEDVARFLKASGLSENPVVTPTHYSGYHVVKISEGRHLNFHSNSTDYPLSCNSLTMRSDEFGQKIIKAIAKNFGGFYASQDTDGMFEEFQSPHKGNLDFMVNRAVILGVTTDNSDNYESFIDFLKKDNPL